MDTLTFLSNIVSATAWPLALLIIAFAFRKQIEIATRLVSKLKVSGIEIEFDKELAVAKEEATRLPEQKEITDNSHEEEKYLISQLAVSAPRSVVIEAWTRVESAAKDCVKRLFGNEFINEKSNSFAAVRFIENNKEIPDPIKNVIRKLRLLRNEAVHASEFDLSASAAILYINIARQLIDNLNTITVTHQRPQ